MKEIVTAQRYAKALLLAVQEEKSLSFDKVQKCLKPMIHQLRSDPELTFKLSHAFVSIEIKKQVLLKAIQKISEPFPRLLQNFLELLLHKKRMDLLPFISSELDRAIEEAQGSIKAYVKSATPLDETSKEQIRKGLEKILNKKILLEISVHPELLAGMVLQAGDTVIDNSLKSQLKNLENKLRFEYGY